MRGARPGNLFLKDGGSGPFIFWMRRTPSWKEKARNRAEAQGGSRKDPSLRRVDRIRFKDPLGPFKKKVEAVGPPEGGTEFSRESFEFLRKWPLSVFKWQVH